MKFHRKSAERARALRHKGVPEADILVALGGKYTSAEIDELIDTIRARERAYAREYYTRHVGGLDIRIVADPSALAERDKRLARNPVSLTAALCGDPLPGYSALDNR